MGDDRCKTATSRGLRVKRSDSSCFHIDPLFNTFQKEYVLRLLLGSYRAAVIPSGNVNPISQITHDSQSKWHFTSNGWLLYITECDEKKKRKKKRTTTTSERSGPTPCRLAVGEPSAAFCHLDRHGNSQIHNPHSHGLQLTQAASVCDGKLNTLASPCCKRLKCKKYTEGIQF